MPIPEKGHVYTRHPVDAPSSTQERTIQILLEEAELTGDLAVPDRARGVVLFAHGSGSSRLSPRNRFVARALQAAGLATLLVDLLTEAEERVDAQTMEHRFDIGLLARRLIGLTDWCAMRSDIGDLPRGYFGASTGSAAALIAAAERPDQVQAVVSRGGRPDLAKAALPAVKAPTLLIVGGEDEPVIELNRAAFSVLTAEKRLEIVPGATHLFEEPGALDAVARLAAEWFSRHLSGR
ncbi:dienelactone hydrolase family protein [Candidatus Nitrospira bockiana]